MTNQNEKVVIGMFDQAKKADRAIESLKQANFRDEAISVMAREGAIRGEVETKMATEVAGDIAIGATGGAAVGSLAGLLTGAVATLIPGVGPVLATGWIMMTIGGASLGAVAGGMSKAIDGRNEDRGLAKDDLDIYLEAIRNDGVIVVVETNNINTTQATQIMRDAQAKSVDIKEDL